MRRHKQRVVMWAVLLGTAGVMSVGAKAQAAIEYSVLVLDQTGSMSVSGQDHGKLGTGQTPPITETFDNAINATINWVVKDRGDLSNQRAYAIYTFKDDQCCLGKQAGLLKIWPLSSSAPGCQSGVDFSHYDSATGFCLFDPNTTDPYDSLNGILDSLRISNHDTFGLLSPIDTGPYPKGGASFNKDVYGLGPNTPLANAFCDAAERLVRTNKNLPLTFTLETDGGENFSAAQPFHACSGDTGGLSSGATSFSKSTSNWGLPNTSWQGNAMRRVTRFNQPGKYPAPLDGGLSANDSQDQSIIGAGPITTPPDDVLQNSKWRIDVHFAICDPNYPSVAPCTTVTTAAAATTSLMSATTATAAPTSRVAATARTSQTSRDSTLLVPISTKSVQSSTPATTAKGKLVTSTTTVATTLAAAPLAATTLAVTTSSRTQSIAATELAFFTALGHVNAKSTFRQFVRDPAAASPVHVPRIAGDIDDSGCTDNADFSIVTQKDVYYQAAVQPNQLAIRADLNGDQWVNKADAQIVLNNWGKGCINPVGPKPKLKY